MSINLTGIISSHGAKRLAKIFSVYNCWMDFCCEVKYCIVHASIYTGVLSFRLGVYALFGLRLLAKLWPIKDWSGTTLHMKNMLSWNQFQKAVSECLRERKQNVILACHTQITIYVVLQILSQVSGCWIEMASCGYSVLLQNSTACGASWRKAGFMQCIAISERNNDISQHLKSCKLVADDGVKDEKTLLLARASKWFCILHTFHDLHFPASKIRT